MPIRSTNAKMFLYFHHPTPSSSPHLHHRPSLPRPLQPSSFTPLKTLTINPLRHCRLCRSHNPKHQPLPPSPDPHDPTNPTKSFYAAVALIVGTAVGPGMLALPSATIKSGTVPSTLAIILSWLYVISSILLVAELTFAAMDRHSLPEVSFTALAADALGPTFGAFVAVVYASLSFSLIVACVSGIGSLVTQQVPTIHPVASHSIIPCLVGAVIGFFPFEAIDTANRVLCGLMLFSITALVVVGVSVGRSSLLGSFACMTWGMDAVLPAIPVTVLTLGFHVITPFVCRIAGDTIYDARRAILIGGAVPLGMVLSWNAVVLGMAGRGGAAFEDPIKLLLSVSSSALPAVRGFAFAALATSLIGYAVSFPKQLADTVRLIKRRFDRKPMVLNTAGRVGLAVYSRLKVGGSGEASFSEDHSSGFDSGRVNGLVSLDSGSSWSTNAIMWGVLIVPIFIASYFNAAFSKALDFAGIYANCFLFGVLPPAMAWIHRSRNRYRLPTTKKVLLPGGSVSLILLFGIAVLLGLWH